VGNGWIYSEENYREVISEKQDGVMTNYYYGNKRISSNERIYVYDGLGNVIQDMSYSGGMLEQYSYSAYGERNIRYNPLLRNSSYGYRGEAHTYDNKQYLRGRYYDVHSEVFIQEDSYRGTLESVESRNRYNYGQNNPYKYSDPSGHDAFSSEFGGGGVRVGIDKTSFIIEIARTEGSIKIIYGEEWWGNTVVMAGMVYAAATSIVGIALKLKSAIEIIPFIPIPALPWKFTDRRIT